MSAKHLRGRSSPIQINLVQMVEIEWMSIRMIVPYFLRRQEPESG